MGEILVVRHARPSATWGEAGDPDPGLDDVGRAQAETAAEALLSQLGGRRPALVVSSPLRRCRETAAPFAARLGSELSIDPRVGEIPTPAGIGEVERGEWLRRAFEGRWRDIAGDQDYLRWRDGVAQAVAGYENAVVFSHFVALNAAASAALGRPEVRIFRPDHASITRFSAADGRLVGVAFGQEAQTGVL